MIKQLWCISMCGMTLSVSAMEKGKVVQRRTKQSTFKPRTIRMSFKQETPARLSMQEGDQIMRSKDSCPQKTKRCFTTCFNCIENCSGCLLVLTMGGLFASHHLDTIAQRESHR